MLPNADKPLVKAYLDKMRAGETPSARETNAFKRFQKDQEETQRWAHYRSVPTKHYQAMSQRDARVLIDQQRKWGIPCAGASVDLPGVLQWTHDFIAENAQKLLALEAGTAGGTASDALERYRLAAAEEKEMAVAQAKGTLVPIAVVEETLGTCVARLTGCLNLVENAIATEFELWLADPRIREMTAEARRRLVREYVARTCQTVRKQEAASIAALLETAARGGGAEATPSMSPSTSSSTSSPATSPATSITAPATTESPSPHQPGGADEPTPARDLAPIT